MKSSDRNDGAVVEVRDLGKIFCRDLRTSLWYGLRDSIGELVPVVGSRRIIDGETHLRAGEFWANRNISFDLFPGESLALVGHNGAGKTTLLKMLNGLIKPNAGTISIRGRVGALIALGAGFNPILTGRENVFVNGAVLGMSRREVETRFDEIVAFADLAHAIDSPVQNYSSGMAVRLGFAIAAHLDPDVLLLDEVLAVGDADFRERCFDRIEKIRKSGTAIVLVSHNDSAIARFCDRALYLENGLVKLSGDVNTVLNAYRYDGFLRNSMRVTVGEDDSATPTGLQTVDLKSVVVLDSGGMEVEVVETFAPIRVRMEYEVTSGVVGKPVAVAEIRDAFGTLFRTDTERVESDLEGLHPAGVIELELEGLHVSNREVELAVAIHSENNRSVLAYRKVGTLKVRNPLGTGGRDAIRHRWIHRRLEVIDE